jgi:alpha-mannosidase
VLEPVKDFLPGAYSDALTIQNWLEVKDNDYGLIWSSHDAPVATFGKLWPGYVSPAHCCVIPERMPHPPQQKDDFKHGWIYSNLFNNNFCTNFSVTQNGEFIFRYSIASMIKALSVPQAISFGMDMSTPLEFIFTSGQYQGELPLHKSFLRIDNKDIILLNCKLADDGNGIVMRFWNPTDSRISSRIYFSIREITEVHEINPAEEKGKRIFRHDKTGFQLKMNNFEIISLIVKDAPMTKKQENM